MSSQLWSRYHDRLSLLQVMDQLVNDPFSRSWSRATELDLPVDLRAKGDDSVAQVDVLDFKPGEGQQSLGALSSQRT